jgi:hypothetical protein
MWKDPDRLWRSGSFRLQHACRRYVYMAAYRR